MIYVVMVPGKGTCHMCPRCLVEQRHLDKNFRIAECAHPCGECNKKGGCK